MTGYLMILQTLIYVPQAFFAGEAYAVYGVAIFPGLLLHQWDFQMKYLSQVQYVSG